jgi:DNA-directed RNA polymerase specialized sigma24 family protein
MVFGDPRGEECLALDAALSKLEAHDHELANLVNLRYFAGLSVDEVCRLTGMSPATYQRHWNYAKTWLLREISTLRDA